MWLKRFFIKDIEEESNMAKKVFTYKVHGDGVKPGVAPHGLVLRSPIDLSLKPGQSTSLDLLVSVDASCLAFVRNPIANEMINDGDLVVYVSNAASGVLLNADERPVLFLANKSQSKTFDVSVKDALIELVPQQDVTVKGS